MKGYTIGLYEKAMPENLLWKEKLTSAKEAGFDYVEISIDETEDKLKRLDWSKEERLELIKTMYDVGIPISSMCLSGHRKYPMGSNDREIEKHSMDIIEKAIQLSNDLGIRIIQLAGYDVYYEQSTPETIARFERNLKKSALMAAKSGIVMGFETMETEFMNTVHKAMKYVNKVDSAYLHVYPDSGNITNSAISYKSDVLEDLRKCKGHVVAIHLKESLKGQFREIPFGTGHVDFRNIIKTAWSIGIRRYVIEMWYKGSETWEDDIQSANKMMTEILDQM